MQKLIQDNPFPITIFCSLVMLIPGAIFAYGHYKRKEPQTSASVFMTFMGALLLILSFVQ